MGFGDFLKAVAGSMLENAERNVQQYNNQLEKNERLTDRQVYNVYKSSSGSRKYAAAATLRERGYGNNNK